MKVSVDINTLTASLVCCVWVSGSYWARAVRPVAVLGWNVSTDLSSQRLSPPVYSGRVLTLSPLMVWRKCFFKCVKAEGSLTSQMLLPLMLWSSSDIITPQTSHIRIWNQVCHTCGSAAKTWTSNLEHRRMTRCQTGKKCESFWWNWLLLMLQNGLTRERDERPAVLACIMLIFNCCIKTQSGDTRNRKAQISQNSLEAWL